MVGQMVGQTSVIQLESQGLIMPVKFSKTNCSPRAHFQKAINIKQKILLGKFLCLAKKQSGAPVTTIST